jgi:hypothetical protein
MARKIYQLMATISEWQNKQTGRKCRQTVSIGSVFEHPGGKLSARLQLLPVHSGWSGWLAFQPCTGPEEAPAEIEDDEPADDEHDDELPPF